VKNLWTIVVEIHSDANLGILFNLSLKMVHGQVGGKGIFIEF